MRKYFYLFILLPALFTACKKDKKSNSTLDLVKDSVYYYAQQTYYWNTSLPSYNSFSPRSFNGSNDIDALTKEVDALSQYAINPQTNRPYEYNEDSPGQSKYSFIDEGGVAQSIGGTNGDFGFAPFWQDDYDLRIKYVYPGSPADVQGVKRGYKITKINNRTDLKYSTTNRDFLIKAYAYSNTINMTLKKPDSTSFDVSISVANYNVNPVLASKVFDFGPGKKVGYMVFNDFTDLSKNAKAKIDPVFKTFQGAGITDLVIDLRYNGGGSVETAQYLSNLMAPESAFGTPMFTTVYNQTITSGKATILKNQIQKADDGSTFDMYEYFEYWTKNNVDNFERQPFGTFSTLNNIFFIVTGSTASASELTINNIIPKRKVFLIGNTTYGKPVGFYAMDINKYQLYVPDFETKNSEGKGGYYTGMEPGSSTYAGKSALDDVTKDFGDPEEQLLKYALNYVKLGTFEVANQRIQSTGNQRAFSMTDSRALGIKMDARRFKGMFFEHPRLRK